MLLDLVAFQVLCGFLFLPETRFGALVEGLLVDELSLDLFDFMDSLDPNENKKEGSVMEDDASDDGELALQVNILKTEWDDKQLKHSVHEYPERDH